VDTGALAQGTGLTVVPAAAHASAMIGMAGATVLVALAPGRQKGLAPGSERQLGGVNPSRILAVADRAHEGAFNIHPGHRHACGQDSQSRRRRFGRRQKGRAFQGSHRDLSRNGIRGLTRGNGRFGSFSGVRNPSETPSPPHSRISVAS